MKERLHYIDVMKGITMLIVVVHHVLWITVDNKNVTNSTMLFLHGWQDMILKLFSANRRQAEK